jgi:beta-N-acetylhexosaminidase
MMYITPQDLTGEKCSTDKELWAKALEEKPVGGIVFLSDNIPSVEGIKGMMDAIYAADAGVFLGLDEEGGEVARLAYALGVTTKFKPMYEYQLKGTGVAYQHAYTIGSDISSFGFNMNFAPVADVWNNYWNTVIGYRSYATDPKRCAELVSAAVEGYHSAGVISVLKHFPGHGNTFEDSHYDAAYTKKSIEEMSDAAVLALANRVQTVLGKQEQTGKVGEELQEAVELGITDGSDPKAFCTRAQAAVMIKRAIQK